MSAVTVIVLEDCGDGFVARIEEYGPNWLKQLDQMEAIALAPEGAEAALRKIGAAVDQARRDRPEPVD